MQTRLDKIDDTIIVTVTLDLVRKSVSKKTYYKKQMTTILNETFAEELTGYTLTSGNSVINNYEKHASTGTYVFTKTMTKTKTTETTETTTSKTVLSDTIPAKFSTTETTKTRKKKNKK